MRQYFTDRDGDTCYLTENSPSHPTFARVTYITGGAKGKTSWQLKANMTPAEKKYATNKRNK